MAVTRIHHTLCITLKGEQQKNEPPESLKCSNSKMWREEAQTSPTFFLSDQIDLFMKFQHTTSVHVGFRAFVVLFTL